MTKRLTKAEHKHLSETFEQLRPLCVAVAMKITRDLTSAEDAVQAAFLNVILHRQRVFALPCHKQAPYIVIVVKNQAYDIMRRNAKEKHVVGLFDQDVDMTVDLLADVVSMESYDALKAMIRALPEDYRQVFEMRYVAELTDKEIAEALGISHSAVRKRLERVRKMLRQKVTADGGGV